jgi:hypothetical protein
VLPPPSASARSLLEFERFSIGLGGAKVAADGSKMAAKSSINTCRQRVASGVSFSVLA